MSYREFDGPCPTGDSRAASRSTSSLGNMQLAIEAKSSARITRDHLKGLRSLVEDHPTWGGASSYVANPELARPTTESRFFSRHYVCAATLERGARWLVGCRGDHAEGPVPNCFGANDRLRVVRGRARARHDWTWRDRGACADEMATTACGACADRRMLRLQVETVQRSRNHNSQCRQPAAMDALRERPLS